MDTIVLYFVLLFVFVFILGAGPIIWEEIKKARFNKRIDEDYKKRRSSAAENTIAHKESSRNHDSSSENSIIVQNLYASMLNQTSGGDENLLSTYKIEITSSNIDAVKKEFIAFDVETTGLSPSEDRIVELAAVRFVDGEAKERFSTLVNSGVPISAAAQQVNKITNDMIASAPSEKEVYPQFIAFLGSALNGEIVLCAHNASFDFGFLANTFSRLGYRGNIKYVDTLRLARRTIKGLENYKQPTLEKYYDISNTGSHRAVNDAECCGKIFYKLLQTIEFTEINNVWYLGHGECSPIQPSEYSKEELSVCAYVENILRTSGKDTSMVRFEKTRGNYIDIMSVYTFFSFKFTKNGTYAIISKNYANEKGLTVYSYSSNEDSDFARFYFQSPFDLAPVSEYILEVFDKKYDTMTNLFEYQKNAKSEYEHRYSLFHTFSEEEIEELLEYAKTHTYVKIIHSQLEAIYAPKTYSRLGAAFFSEGEELRKAGQLQEAISKFETALSKGYNSPSLYEACAKAYHKLKDYENEIMIIEKALNDIPLYRRSDFEKRLERAKDALEYSIIEKRKRDNPRPTVRRVVQMDSDGAVIKEFESIAQATRETGINSKSIRQAANGRQKHAGGYCWKFGD